MFDSIVRKIKSSKSGSASDSTLTTTKSINQNEIRKNRNPIKQSISFNNQTNCVMIDLYDPNNQQFLNSILNCRNNINNNNSNIKIIYLKDNNSQMNTKINEVHIYEEIQDQQEHQQHLKTFMINENLSYFKGSNNKKSVRFKPLQSFNNYNISCPSTTSSCSSSSFNSILKKSIKINQPELVCLNRFNHQNNSNNTNTNQQFYSSSTSSSSNNSTLSNASTSQHSIAFNNLVEEFLNKLNTPPSLSLSNTTSSSNHCDRKKNSDKIIIDNNNNNFLQNENDKLSVRVSNLTLEDLKNRQKCLKKLKQQQNMINLKQHSSFNSIDSNNSCASSSTGSRPISNYYYSD
jgi:hypothetical protein